MRIPLHMLWIGAVTAAGLLPAAAADDRAGPRPGALVDLATTEGAALLGVEWRSHPADLVEIDFPAAGPDHRPSGPPGRTHDLLPRAGVRDFDDSGWERLDPRDLESRRGPGKLSAVWFRFALTLPERLAAFDVAGSTAVLELVVDDYAEVWVDGRLPLVPGQAGGHLVKGWNAPNRVVLGRDLRPGRTIQVAVLGINGPLSDLPANYVWVRSATVEFHRAGALDGAERVPLEVVRLSDELDAVLPAEPVLERLAGGFQFAEGPVWSPSGHLLFSDPNANVIYRWAPDHGVSVFRTKSGYTGVDIGLYGQPGSNGLGLDPQGRLVICEHGNRRLTRLEPNGVLTVLADRHEGRRLNSPNDVVVARDGTIYFTDPAFGLPRWADDPRRQLPFCGIYRLRDGELTLLDGSLAGPNGIALSPDERFLYVGDWDVERKVVMRWELLADGGLGAGHVLVDLTDAAGEEAIDGVEVDASGNLYVSGPGGLWIVAPTGERLGRLTGPELAANFAWGDDGRTLYLTARTGLYRLRLRQPGAAFAGVVPPAASEGRPR